jgi:hypothetical protein
MADTAKDDVVPDADDVDDADPADDTDDADDADPADDVDDADPADDTDDADDADPQPSRGESRQAQLARENRELREEKARNEGELQALRQRPAEDPAKSARVREEKLSLMTAEERREYERDERLQRLESEAANSRLVAQGMADKNSYDVLCARNTSVGKLAEKYRKEVDRLHMESFKNGTFVPRQTFLDYVIGKNAREAAENGKMKKQTQAEKDAAAERVKKAKTKPSSGRSDAGSSGGKGGDDLASHWDRLIARRRSGDTN